MEDESPEVGAAYHLITHRLTSEDESWFGLHTRPGPPATRCSVQQLAARTVKRREGSLEGLPGLFVPLSHLLMSNQLSQLEC